MNKRSFSFIAVSFLFCFMLASCASSEKQRNEARAHYKMGLSHLNSKNYQSAYLEFQTSMQLNQSDKEVHNALGIVYLSLDDINSAEKSFQRAVEVGDDYSEGYNNLCYVYINKREWDNAIKNCKKALENPLYATPDKAFYNLGRVYYLRGSFQDAENAFNNAIKRAPSMPHGYYGIALSRNAMGKYSQAADALTRAIEFDPRFKGDRHKAELEFMHDSLEAKDPKDLVDYLEILKY